MLRGAAEQAGFKDSEKLASLMKSLKLNGTLDGGKSKPSKPNTTPKKEKKLKKVKKPAGKTSK
jgi:hypothetical protein